MEGDSRIVKRRKQKFKEVKSNRKKINYRIPIAPEERTEAQKKKYNRNQEKREWREEVEEWFDYT